MGKEEWRFSNQGGIPMQKKYIVRLTEEERETCREVIHKLKGSSQKSC